MSAAPSVLQEVSSNANVCGAGFTEEGLQRMPRKKLQALAKRHGVKANSKSVKIISELLQMSDNRTKTEQTQEQENPLSDNTSPVQEEEECPQSKVQQQAGQTEVSVPMPMAPAPKRSKTGVKTPFKMKSTAEIRDIVAQTKKATDQATYTRTRTVFADDGTVIRITIKNPTKGQEASRPRETFGSGTDLEQLGEDFACLDLDESIWRPWFETVEGLQGQVRCTLTGTLVPFDEASILAHMESAEFERLRAVKIVGLPSPKGRKTLFDQDGEVASVMTLNGWE